MVITRFDDPNDHSLEALKRRREEVQRQLQQYEQEIESLEKEERKGVIESVRQLIDQWKLTQNELFPSAKVKTKTAAGIPKYQHPDNPELTWTGRGPRPKWVKEWIDSKKPLDELKVKGAQ